MQLKLERIPNNDIVNLRTMVKAKVDGCKSVADLVRKLLAERFVRYLAERAQGTKGANAAPKRRVGLAGKLVVGKHAVVVKPPRERRTRGGAAGGTNGSTAHDLAQPSLPLPLGGERTGKRARATTKHRGAANGAAQLG
jgi:hypothetical protein